MVESKRRESLPSKVRPEPQESKRKGSQGVPKRKGQVEECDTSQEDDEILERIWDEIEKD